ncbi:MAG: hypothetical protein ACTHMS_04880 [Jatrophihabitans sp.]|uniref:hypothetical protein n=1 Tax=Jatrophihabitans sp. TaxID=1932789 RepID=UPI003F7F909F
MVIPCALLAGAAILFVAAFGATTHGGYRVYGAVLGTFAGLVGAMTLAVLLRALRPLTVKGGTIRIAHGLRTIRVPLTEVTGLGLLFQYVGVAGRRAQQAGWFPYVWDGDARPHRIPAAALVAPHWTPATRWAGPLPWGTAEQLAASRTGKAVSELRSIVLAVQGEHGPLRRQAEETRTGLRSPSLAGLTYACWPVATAPHT